jgi:hypothetical protein
MRELEVFEVDAHSLGPKQGNAVVARAGRRTENGGEWCYLAIAMSHPGIDAASRKDSIRRWIECRATARLTALKSLRTRQATQDRQQQRGIWSSPEATRCCGRKGGGETSAISQRPPEDCRTTRRGWQRSLLHGTYTRDQLVTAELPSSRHRVVSLARGPGTKVPRSSLARIGQGFVLDGTFTSASSPLAISRHSLSSSFRHPSQSSASSS